MSARIGNSPPPLYQFLSGQSMIKFRSQKSALPLAAEAPSLINHETEFVSSQISSFMQELSC
jgi:hypothetical protein